MRVDDLIISLAYFSIPLQILVSLYHYPRLASMPPQLFILSVLFALFIFCCGAGHTLRCLGHDRTFGFAVMNGITALVSLTTALYLLPLVPSIMNELNSSLQKLVKLNEETAESKRKLFTFMAFLCHEIRNPLFAITTNIEFAQDMEMSEELRSALTSVNQSTTLMLRLVNDVLDLSKIESGKLELEEEDVDIREFFRNVAGSMSGQLRQKGHDKINFVFKMSDDLPQIVTCDSVRILQIAYNLLSNASKFTEEGFVAFSVSVVDFREATEKGLVKKQLCLSASSEEDNELERFYDEKSETFSMALLAAVEEGRSSTHKNARTLNADVKVLKMVIEDSGSGIPPERVQRIFQPYTQSKLSDFRKHGGTGLGLSIIAKLTEIMGGTVTVQSIEGRGSTFTVHLPLIVPNRPRDVYGQDNSCRLRSDSVEKTILPDSLTSKPSLQEAPNEAAPLFALDTPLNTPNSASNTAVPLFSTKISINAPVSAPLFNMPSSAAKNTLISSSPSSAQSATSSLNQVSPQDPATSQEEAIDAKLPTANENKAPLTKFDFSKNTNVVLVVDDNSVNRKLIGKMLAFFNIEYEQAQHGQEAVDIMKRSRNMTGKKEAPCFGMVIMDLCMPVMDGYEAIEKIRGLGLQLPMIALTANALEEGKQMALAVGANEFATKPILRHVLHAKCRKYLRQPPLIPPPPQQKSTIQAPSVSMNGSNGGHAPSELWRYCADEDHIVNGESELICLTPHPLPYSSDLGGKPF